ncbi:PemK-like protein [Gloeomargarita lithophora Alchichica-D10]|uniref:PemK-like protein n=1 Tax=Gloeomargarita lithophora Alchichica-D10 TaxID=1188229 RepID=A0A1J0A994_9CYAN|nr:type II toxin-antitoxin system PemK/MazF family toxin [Gloeomargarita lithophora]APB32487.1 PemK-like protein [Gloeomargarita lithophora Alchichica-D10]
MNDPHFPRQGFVYLSKALKPGGDTKKRPVLVVSSDIRNQHSRTILVVPFSSDIDASSGHPGRVVVNTGDGGLERPSVALCDLITTVEKHYLDTQTYGVVQPQPF